MLRGSLAGFADPTRQRDAECGERSLRAKPGASVRQAGFPSRGTNLGARDTAQAGPVRFPQGDLSTGIPDVFDSQNRGSPAQCLSFKLLPDSASAGLVGSRDQHLGIQWREGFVLNPLRAGRLTSFPLRSHRGFPSEYGRYYPQDLSGTDIDWPPFPDRA